MSCVVSDENYGCLVVALLSLILICDDDIMQQAASENEDVSIYDYGCPTQFFTVILDGKVEVLAGREKYRTIIGKLGVLAADAIVIDEAQATAAQEASIFVMCGWCIYSNSLQNVKISILVTLISLPCYTNSSMALK